jgi:competence protein ComEC
MTFPDPSTFTVVIDQYFAEPYASLLNGILFGIELRGVPVFYDQVKRVGLLHIVVLSGINITMVGAAIAACTKQFGRKLSAVISIAAVVMFIMFVGPDPPVVRAGIMGVLSLLAVVYERKTLTLYSLFLSAVVVAIFKWEWITSVSFQLSFGATLGIILWGSGPPQKISHSSLGSLRRMLKEELRLTGAASIFTVPIIYLYFKEISLIAPLANILVSFAMPPIMIMGFLTSFLGKVHFFAGIIPAYLTFGLVWYVVCLIEILSALPYIFITLS